MIKVSLRWSLRPPELTVVTSSSPPRRPSAPPGLPVSPGPSSPPDVGVHVARRPATQRPAVREAGRVHHPGDGDGSRAADSQTEGGGGAGAPGQGGSSFYLRLVVNPPLGRSSLVTQRMNQ